MNGVALMKPFAFVFPGQGSQSVGMLDGWGDHPQVLAALAEASDALHEDIGLLIKEGPKEALALTTNTQPVMLVAGVAAYRVWMADVGVAPAAVAGHSLGEYSALVASGVLTLAQAAPLVRFRAQAMQEAVPVGVGAMAAILGLDASKVIAICAEVTGTFAQNGSEVVEAVNFNDPGQTVIAGSKTAVVRPGTFTITNLGMFDVTEFAAPQIPVINNIDVAVEQSPERIRDALVRQAFGPVRWVECVQALQARGLSTLVECGPGRVLAGLTKRIALDMQGVALFDPASLAEVKSTLSEA